MAETVFGPDREDPIDIDVVTLQERSKDKLVTLSFSQPCLRSQHVQSCSVRCQSAPKSNFHTTEKDKMIEQGNILRKCNSIALPVSVTEREHLDESENLNDISLSSGKERQEVEQTELSSELEDIKNLAVCVPLDTTEILLDDEMTINEIAKLYDLETCHDTREQPRGEYGSTINTKATMNDFSGQMVQNIQNYELPGHPISPKNEFDEEPHRVTILEENEDQKNKQWQWWALLVSCFKRR